METDRGQESLKLLMQINWIPLRIRRIVANTMLSKMQLNTIPALLGAKNEDERLQRVHTMSTITMQMMKKMIDPRKQYMSPSELTLQGFSNPIITEYKLLLTRELQI